MPRTPLIAFLHTTACVATKQGELNSYILVEWGSLQKRIQIEGYLKIPILSHISLILNGKLNLRVNICALIY